VNPGSDLVVVGAGAAGLFACLSAAEARARVTLVSARPLAETASYWAQGGLAAALAVDDSPELHLQDTLTAGRDLVRRSAAEVLTSEAPARFHELEALGVRFDADRHGNLALGLEGGHGTRRVVHAGGSATGRRILRQLSADVAEHPSIEVLEGARAARLATADGRCAGVALEDGRTLYARGTILATGGAAALWSRTTNPPG
jgi:L-aspartate oxidase